MEKDEIEQEAISDVAYGTQHALNVLLDVLIEKGVISKQEYLDRLDQDVEESPELDEINIELPNDE